MATPDDEIATERQRALGLRAIAANMRARANDLAAASEAALTRERGASIEPLRAQLDAAGDAAFREAEAFDAQVRWWCVAAAAADAAVARAEFERGWLDEAT